MDLRIKGNQDQTTLTPLYRLNGVIVSQIWGISKLSLHKHCREITEQTNYVQFPSKMIW